MNRARLVRVASLALLLPLVGCMLGPQFHKPQAALPAQWTLPDDADVGGRVRAGAQADAVWWRSLGDAELDTLVQRALQANLDLRLAQNRLEQSRLARGVVAADRKPSAALNASASRARNSEVGLSDPSGNSGRADYGLWQGGVALSWELDLWGRVRRQVEVADAQLAMSEEDWHGTQLTVMAETARAYLQLRGVQQLRAITEDNLRSTRDALALTQMRLREGVATDLDLASAAAQVAAIEAGLPALEQRQSALVNALGLLLAQPPQALAAELARPVSLSALPASVPLGLPSELAERRPDIRRAEAALHAATAGIGIAKASFYPRISLSGDAGYQAQQLADFGGWDSHRFAVGPVLSLPLFQGGRLKANLALSRVREQQAALQFQKIVLAAWAEVDDALGSYRAEQRRRDHLHEAVAQNRLALARARQQYQAGSVDMLDVLALQRGLLGNEAALADSSTASALALVGVYRALGGGWRGDGGEVATR